MNQNAATAVFALFLTACAASAPVDDHSLFPVLHAAWQQARVWTFDVTDSRGAPMGYVTLGLTAEAAPAGPCGQPGGYRAEILDVDMKYEFVAELLPTYVISGPWITVDLTSGACNAAYKFIGTASESGASGYFNFVHSVGAENIGSFNAYARPGSESESDGKAISFEN